MSQMSIPQFVRTLDFGMMPDDATMEHLASKRSEVERIVTQLKEQLDSEQVNVEIIKYFKDKRREHDKKLADLKELEGQLQGMKGEYETKKQERLKMFRSGFDLIAQHVKAIYRLITNGGDADLETID